MINITKSEEQTELLGEKLAAELKVGDWLALYGPLGSGKTSFTRGICRGLGSRGDVHSPTFNILNIYPGPAEVAHIDLYRLGRDLDDIGWDDLGGANNIVIIEWAEKAGDYLPAKRIEVNFKVVDLNTREIEIVRHYDIGA
jgi:tRNA threonylcarbamoyladenosine biosynthesis protein TsaE